MIYISSSCIRRTRISESIRVLGEAGFRNIELSGGTKYYENIEQDLLNLKQEYNLEYQCHNYFPPPKEPFVINLASTEPTIYHRSKINIQDSLTLSKSLGATRYGFHAGFYINPHVKQLGKGIERQQLASKSIAMEQFIKGYSELKSHEPDVELYIENNVISAKNYDNYQCNPFMLTNSSEYDELRSALDFKLLLDVAHLKVSTRTMGLNYFDELEYLIEKTDYIHISDNDGTADTNRPLTEESELFKILSKHSLKDKTITLEIYDEIDKIRLSYDLLKSIIVK